MNRENAILEAIVQKRVELRYLEYLPRAYDQDPDRRWPLVVFLHGKDERGSRLEMVSARGLPRLASRGEEFPFILVAPQCPLGQYWDMMDDELEALLKHATETYRVDSSRIYLTGLSMGGFGTWGFATRHPHAFAAIVPVCGGGEHWRDFPEAVRSITHVPVWAFHGAKDSHVPVEMSRALVDELKAAGATEARLTVYPDVEHNSWDNAYDTDALYAWLLSKTNDTFEL